MFSTEKAKESKCGACTVQFPTWFVLKYKKCDTFTVNLKLGRMVFRVHVSCMFICNFHNFLSIRRFLHVLYPSHISSPITPSAWIRKNRIKFSCTFRVQLTKVCQITLSYWNKFNEYKWNIHSERSTSTVQCRQQWQSAEYKIIKP